MITIPHYFQSPLAGLMAACSILGGLPTPAVSGELPDVTTRLFSGSANCAFCHDQWGGALIDREDRDVSIAGDWRATMMAHAFKDPLWRARMAAEVQENPARAFADLYHPADKSPELVQAVELTL